MPPKRKPGRPKVLKDGSRVNVFLDRATIDKAKRIGQGELSAGLRQAVAKFRLG